MVVNTPPTINISSARVMHGDGLIAVFAAHNQLGDQQTHQE
jgi:hypothetical protein